ncbi:hypothetical protein GJ496_007779 [Pomphorhynchus laevis]|nr:hypothetical protein GJ496_007779 [Pomphorhynchus laevis]
MFRSMAKALNVAVLTAGSDNYMYVISHSTSNACVLVDPWNAKKALNYVDENNLNLACVLTTHHHLDHSGGNKEIINYIDVPVYGMDSRILCITNKVKDKAQIQIDALRLKFIHTPCHTQGHMCILASSNTTDEPNALFTGDTLFIGGCGRFFEGNAHDMCYSLDVLAKLSPETLVYCGHEYTVKNLSFAKTVEPDNKAIKEKLKWAQDQAITVPSTIGEELKYNPFMRLNQSGIQNFCNSKIPSEYTFTVNLIRRFVSRSYDLLSQIAPFVVYRNSTTVHLQFKENVALILPILNRIRASSHCLKTEQQHHQLSYEQQSNELQRNEINDKRFSSSTAISSGKRKQPQQNSNSIIRIDVRVVYDFIRHSDFEKTFKLYTKLMPIILNYDDNNSGKLRCSEQHRRLPLLAQSTELSQDDLNFSVQGLLRAYNSLRSSRKSDYSSRSITTVPLAVHPCAEEIQDNEDTHVLDAAAANKRICHVNNVKLIRLKVNDFPIGVTITIDKKHSLPVIQRVVQGGVAQMAGVLKKLDRILEVNNISVEGLSLSRVLDMINRNLNCGSFISMLVQSSSPDGVDDKELETVRHHKFWRSNVSYQPDLDKELPCPELGSSLVQGQIFQLVEDSDPNYWQVYILNCPCSNRLACIIPSLELQEQRWGVLPDDKLSFKPYEPVILYHPRSECKRLIVAVSPFQIDLSLLLKLYDHNDEILLPTYHYCNRKNVKSGTVLSKYNLPRHVFEADLLAGRFIDVEWRGRKPTMGISFESVRHVIYEKNKIALIQANPECLQRFRTTDLHPYVIFVAYSDVENKSYKTAKTKKQQQARCFNKFASGLPRSTLSSTMITLYGYLFDEIVSDESQIIKSAIDIQLCENWICV